MNAADIADRLGCAFDTVLPEAAFDVTSDADGGITVRVRTSSPAAFSRITHEAELSRACDGGDWWWHVSGMHPTEHVISHAKHGIADFDSAAATMVGILAGAMALLRMAEATASVTPKATKECKDACVITSSQRVHSDQP